MSTHLRIFDRDVASRFLVLFPWVLLTIRPAVPAGLLNRKGLSTVNLSLKGMTHNMGGASVPPSIFFVTIATTLQELQHKVTVKVQCCVGGAVHVLPVCSQACRQPGIQEFDSPHRCSRATCSDEASGTPALPVQGRRRLHLQCPQPAVCNRRAYQQQAFHT